MAILSMAFFSVKSSMELFDMTVFLCSESPDSELVLDMKNERCVDRRSQKLSNKAEKAEGRMQ